MLITGLGTAVRELPSPIVFEQLDGSPVKGGPCTHCTAPLLLGMDPHWEEKLFIIAPTASYPVLL